jgi:ParB family chromosome partitioning protein
LTKTQSRRSVSDYLSTLPTEPETDLPIELISIETSQPRRYFDPEKLQQLADSIRQFGIIEPLLVRQKESNYFLVAGERRYRAAKMAELKTVPVVVRELSDEEALAVALVENLVREDLNPIEETEGILCLLALELQTSVEEVKSLLYRWDNEQKGKATNNVIGSDQQAQIKSVFEGLGQSWQSFVNNRLPLLKLPSHLLCEIRKGTIAYTKAKAISTLKNEEQQKTLLDSAISEQLSLTEIKQRIKTLKEQQQNKDTALNGQGLNDDEENLFNQQVNKTNLLLKKAKPLKNRRKQKKLLRLLSEIETLLNETKNL